MSRLIIPLVAVVEAQLVMVGIGCSRSGPSVAPEVLSQQRARFVLAEEPDGAQTVLEVREALLGKDVPEHSHEEEGAHGGHDHAPTAGVKATEPLDVLMVGSVGGLANPWEETQPDYPFTKNQAILFLADLGEVAKLEALGHEHAPGEECAFCAAHAGESSAMLAMVRFMDENGKVLPIAVRQLFDVNEKDTVVIQGSARIVDGGMMVVDATGFYARR
jgi:hypothetical protein